MAFEVWVTNKDILFDNLVLSRDYAAAKAHADATWAVRHAVESERQEEELSKVREGGWMD